MKNNKNLKAQNVQEASFSILPLSLIDRSAFNPRKIFNENELKELAESIKEKGVIQPIVVRKKGKRYEVVCGERRYRGSLLAGIETIPACIRELSDEEAEEFAITENLQRVDVLPMEEARAFSRLVEVKKYDVSSLVLKFGKSDAFIRGRMKLMLLIEPFVVLLEKDEIKLGIASILANYSNETQESVYNEHFEEGVQPYYSWVKKRPAELIECIERAYSTELDSYSFDKEECLNCPFNTANFQLFIEGASGKCTKKECLSQKNKRYVLERAQAIQSENPNLSFCTGRWNSGNSLVLEELREAGNEITEYRMIDISDNAPTVPERDDFDEEEDFQEAIEEYKEELKDYEQEKVEFEHKIKEGEVVPFIQIEAANARIAYAMKCEVEQVETQVSESTISSSEKEIIGLKSKIQRNNELCGEKIREDLRETLKKITLSGNEVSSLEEGLKYYFMAHKVRNSIFSLLGWDKNYYQLKYTDFLELTENQKAIITREYLVDHLSTMYVSSRDIREQNALRGFMNQHVPDEVVTIDTRQENIYNKRNARLLERIEAIEKNGIKTEK